MSMLIWNLSRRFYMHNHEHNINMIEKENILSNIRPYIIKDENEIDEKVNNIFVIEKLKFNIVWINLTVKGKYFDNEKIILRDINGFVEFGTMMALMGPSGAGKSTLLKTLMGMNRNLMTRVENLYE